MIITRQRSDRFAIIPNAVAEDERLTFEARGVLVYLLAKPNDWQVKIADLQRAGNIGRDKVYRILAELMGAGYIVRNQAVKGDGKFSSTEYIIYDDPVPEQLPFPENTEADRPLPEKPQAVAPLPEKPLPVRPHTANTDALIRTQSLPKNQNTNNPTNTVMRSAGLWNAWDQRHRPDRRDLVEGLYTQLPADIDRHLAVKFAAAWQQMMKLRKKSPSLITYLKAKAWREMNEAPPIDSAGRFVITPDRDEWPAWLEDIRASSGETGVQMAIRAGRILRNDRWPTAATLQLAMPMV